MLPSLAALSLSAGPVATERDVICTAALLRNHTEIPFAAVSLCIPKARYDEQPRAFRTICQTAAARISADLGSCAV